MRHEETAFTKVRYEGKLGPVIGDRTDVPYYRLEEMSGGAYLALNSSQLHASIVIRSLPHLLNFYRDLGDLLNEIQPGLTLPLPEGDPSEIDAMKVIFEADRVRGEK